MSESKRIKTALVSVYHKEGLDEIITKLHEEGVEFLSTGGTRQFIESLGYPCKAVEDLTSYPSILGGRVKTLHPKIFGGILCRRGLEQDIQQIEKYEIPEIDLVIVDLYPFEATVASGADEAAIIEKIDIGGISLIRAAAKNYNDVVIVASQAQYKPLLDMLMEHGANSSLEERRWMAKEAFAVSSHYDSAIFNYFDAPLVGLTATPKDEIDKNTYEIFELENGVPTYGYELAQAVKDGYLVDFLSVETKLKFIEQGIVYDELSDEDKQAYEDTFEDENGELPERIASSALNEWIFNEDTIRQVLNTLMTHGLTIDYGSKLGKTIIFAKNHTHAEKILAVFNKEYPHLPGFAKVIDNYMTYAQSAIDEFSDPKKLPQIAISVDMLDTGIDVPEVLNLVFFKKVMSKAKFWQMIGRGTRLCPGLMDGKDKDKFYIFDFCGNFEFFRMNKGRPTANMIALQGAIFHLKAQIAFKLQDLAYQTTDLIAFRKTLVEDMVRKVRELNKENFAVRQHLKYVERYAEPDSYSALTYEDTLLIGQELAPLITPEEDDAKALRFDALLYGIELAYLVGKKYGKARSDLFKKVSAVAAVANIPEIMVQAELIDKILHTDYVETAGINEFEYIRENLRDLIKYIPVSKVRYDTNFDDEILSVDWKESELENDDLKNYKAKAEFYVRQHMNDAVIAKLKGNVPLTVEDVQALEKALWSEVGTKQDYVAEYGQKPLGEFVREIVGVDMNAAKEAFAQYLNDASLDSRQIYFVNQIVEYIVHNGMMKDMSVLQEAPFTDYGSIVEVFTDLSVWAGIRQAIERVNANALAA